MSIELPASLKPITHIVNVGNDYANRDVIIYYWCLYRAVQEGMKLDKSSPEALNFLTTTLSTLEKIKTENPGVDALTQDVVAQAHVEDQAQRLFNYAESQDSAGIFNMKIVKSFYTCGYLFDVLSLFGEPDENVQSAKKYAKWRATYIHNCLKKGETPIPGNKIIESETNGNNPADVADVTTGFQNINMGGSTGSGTSSQSISVGIANDTSAPYPQDAFRGATAGGNYNFNSAVPRTNHGAHSPAAAGAFGQSGFQHSLSPAQPAVSPNSWTGSQPTQIRTENYNQEKALTVEDIAQAKKFTKFALSALDYDDAKTAIMNMQKALAILQK